MLGEGFRYAKHAIVYAKYASMPGGSSIPNLDDFDDCRAIKPVIRRFYTLIKVQLLTAHTQAWIGLSDCTRQLEYCRARVEDLPSALRRIRPSARGPQGAPQSQRTRRQERNCFRFGLSTS